MGNYLTNREYIRKIIGNAFIGNKISKLESQKLEQAIFSFDQKD